MSSCLSHASCISYFKPDADGSNSTGFSPDNGDVWDPPTDPNGASVLEMKSGTPLVAQLRGSRDLSPQMLWRSGSGAAGYGMSGGGGRGGDAGYGNANPDSTYDRGYAEYQQAM